MNLIHVLMVACVNNITLIFVLFACFTMFNFTVFAFFSANVTCFSRSFFFVVCCFNTSEPIARANERNQLALTDTADEMKYNSLYICIYIYILKKINTSGLFCFVKIKYAQTLFLKNIHKKDILGTRALFS